MDQLCGTEVFLCQNSLFTELNFINHHGQLKLKAVLLRSPILTLQREPRVQSGVLDHSFRCKGNIGVNFLTDCFLNILDFVWTLLVLYFRGEELVELFS